MYDAPHEGSSARWFCSSTAAEPSDALLNQRRLTRELEDAKKHAYLDRRCNGRIYPHVIILLRITIDKISYI
jgi:hypothetical protein